MFKKTISIIVVVLISTLAYAGHEKGGIIITYKSLASVNGNPLEYLVEAYAIYETGGIPPQASLPVSITSSCFTNYVISVPRIGGLTPANSADYCTPGTNIGGTSGIAYFRDTVVLGGTCSDFLFAHVGGFGRYFNTTNIDDNFSGSAYFGVSLDNTLGPNSCPTLPLTHYIQGLCLNTPLVLYGFNDIDGDSLYFSPSAPQRSTSSAVVDYPYKTGYTQANQVGSTLGFSLNPNNGVVQTTIGSQGNYLITIRFQEYRKDSLGIPIEIGEGRFSFVAIGASSCTVPAARIKYRSIPNANQVLCGSQSLDIAVNRRLATSTVAPDASDFLVFNQSGPISVAGAVALSDSIVQLQLSNPIPGGMDLYVTSDTGTDGNVMISVCGNHFPAVSDTLAFTPQGSGNPMAAFNYSSNLLQVNFDGSASSGDSLHWHYGDAGATGSGIMPTHNYSSSGVYSVLLRVFDNCGGEDSLFQTITICDSLIASFQASVNGDTILLNSSVSGASQIIWDLGDGSSDTGAVVSHVYSNPGQYYVQLTAYNICGDTIVIGDTVNSCLTPVSSFTAVVKSTGGTGMVVDFDGTSSIGASSWLWEFGDGATDATNLTPTHTYQIPGLQYMVSLTVVNSCGESTTYGYRLNEIGLKEFEESIKIYPNPASNFIQIEINTSLSGLLSLTLTSSTGQAIWSRQLDLEGEQDILIPVDQLPRGWYTLKMENNHNSGQYTLILE